MLLGLTGCAGFFPPLTTTTTTTTTTTGDYVYVANQTTETISGFAVGTGTLTAVSGSPYTLAAVPTAMVVTPSNSFLYVAAGIDIYAYTIGTGGALTAANSGGAVALTDVGAVSMDVSPDGQWLFALSGDGTVIYEYAINATTGVLTAQATPSYVPASGTVAPKMIKVAPSGAYVFVALGTGGDLVFPFTTSTGALGTTYQQLATGSTTTSDNAIAVDSGTTYLYIARSGAATGVAVYAIGSGGTLTSVTGSSFAAGSGPYAVLLDSTGKYVYAANRTDGTVSGFAIGTGGVLTALTGSPFASGAGVTSLARDNSAKYVLAAASGGSPDLSLYSFDATTLGKLDLTATAASGSDPAGSVVVVATH
jgi:6-phosphogluconolactonase (cycloisomerase 2 family)